jgi:hypothetical protein
MQDVLESGIKFANDNNNKSLSTVINKILENIAKLEKVGRLSKTDRYESFVRDISKEVANRRIIREQQKKEIDRLKGTLASLRKHQQYINDQISQYQKYLQKIKGNIIKPQKGKKVCNTSFLTCMILFSFICRIFSCFYPRLQLQDLSSSLTKTLRSKVSLLTLLCLK